MSDPPESIRELADRLERNYADGHSDVELLAHHHVIHFEGNGRVKRPVDPTRGGRIRLIRSGGLRAGARLRLDELDR